MSEPTPLPWHVGMRPEPIIYGPRGEEVANLRDVLLEHGETLANAQRIVRAVNAYDDMLAALRQIRNIAVGDYSAAALSRMDEIARAAIAKANT